MPRCVNGDRAEPVTDDAQALKERPEAVTGEHISALEGIGENVRLEHKRGRGKDGKAPLDRGLPGRETTAPFSAGKEIEPAVSCDKAPEPEPPARGKGVEMNMGL